MAIAVDRREASNQLEVLAVKILRLPDPSIAMDQWKVASCSEVPAIGLHQTYLLLALVVRKPVEVASRHEVPAIGLHQTYPLLALVVRKPVAVRELEDLHQNLPFHRVSAILLSFLTG